MASSITTELPRMTCISGESNWSFPLRCGKSTNHHAELDLVSTVKLLQGVVEDDV